VTRISERDAIRLGIMPAPVPAPSGKAKAKAAAVPRRKRVLRKAGRARLDADHGAFEVALVVPFEPKTKQRARTSLSKGDILKAFHSARGDAGAFARMLEGIRHNTYTPDDTAAFERAVAVIGGGAMRGREPYAGPLHVEIVFTLAGDEVTWPTDVTDPDLDNLEKAFFDALNGVVWKDDRVIVSKQTRKVCGPVASISMRARPASAAG